MKEKKVPSAASLPMIITSVVFVALPLCYIVALSFMEKAPVWGVIAEFSAAAYRKILDASYVRSFADSMKLALSTTIISLVLSYPFAYYTAKMKSGIRSFVLTMVIVPFWTNSLVRIYGWMIILRGSGVIESVLKGVGVISQDTSLKLLYNQGAVTVGMVYALIPFMILAIYNAVEKMDWSVVEAARDLGAGPVRAFFTTTLPMTKAGVFAGCVLVFVPSVGLFFISDLLGGSKVMLIGNVIRDELLKAKNWPVGAALSIVLILMTVLVLYIYKKASGAKDWEGLF